MSKRNLWLAVGTLSGLLILASTGAAQIKAGDMVTFDYTLTDDKGAQLDSSKGKQPLAYQHGSGTIIPGLEKELLAMSGEPPPLMWHLLGKPGRFAFGTGSAM